ncbi:MFS transporter [Cytobacillus purgationiresistens]|uniref:MFS family permease n=1 Tax=Cytobacillus purgationiresistens TaxID=863449 RepID=A0ABU0ANQ1_9BACI|nr:MFS transporter [Cytobacillus purgationiresistens]MDQ0272906.1 MFS family permease [Cytobacillus purgationiresistens]
MIFHVLKDRNISLYIAGAATSSLGSTLSGLGFLFIAYELTASSLQITGIAIAQAIPYLLFGLAGGVIADWFDKKRLLICMELLRTPLILSIVVFSYLEMLTFTYLLLVSFLIQSLGCFFNPAHRAMLPLIVAEERRSAVNSLLDSATRGIQVLSPLVSLSVMHAIGVIHFFTIHALAYLLSAFFISRLYVTEETVITTKRGLSNIYGSIIDFVVWVKGQSTLVTLFAVTFIIVFSNTWVWQVGLLLQLIDTTAHGQEWYSILLSLYGGIVIVTNLLIPFIWNSLNLKIYMYGSMIWGAGIFILGFAASLPVYFIGVCIAGIGLPIASLTRVYLLQKLVPPDKLGRGFSFNAVLLYLSNILSLALFGFFSSYLSTSLLFKVCGAFMLTCAAAYLLNFWRKSRGVTPYNRLNS